MNKVKLLIIVTLIVISIMMPSFYLKSIAIADNSTKTNFDSQDAEFKLAFLSVPAYYYVEIHSGSCYNKDYNVKPIDTDLSANYVSLNNAEFREFVKSKIEILKNDPNIVWDREFLDNFVKPLSMKLYSEIINSNHKNIKIFHSAAKSINGVFTSQTSLISYPKTLLGVTLAKFECSIYWSWDGTKIISVLPSTYGIIYSPYWAYKGIVSNLQYFYNNHENFRKIVKGDFTYTYPPPLNWVRHYYPTLDITLYADGNITTYDSGW